MESKKQSILGCLPKGVFLNLLVGLLALISGAIAGGPYISISWQRALIYFLILIVVYLGVTFLAIFSLRGKIASGQLQENGIYRYWRHPMYGAIIFLLNPALAILLRSWLLVVACFIDYFIWRSAVKSEEKELVQMFGDDYLRYKKNTWAFFPNLLKINKPAFFVLAGLVVFICSFVFINSSALYLRFVGWRNEQSTEVVITRPVRLNTANSLPGVNSGSVINGLPASQDLVQEPRYEKENSIVIEKIKIDVPLVFASGTSQSQLNSALNNGVVIYPGSKLPGQEGEVFLTGHSSSYPWVKTKYGQVFTMLDKLENGDIVIIYYNQYKYEYQITNKSVVTPDRAIMKEEPGKKTLTLFTCWPIGTAWKRLMVEGVQIE